MASRTSRREWVRGLPWAFGVGRYDRKQIHSVSERAVGYGFLIGESVQNHPNPHLYQTGSKRGLANVMVFATISFSSNTLEGRGAPFFGRLGTKSTPVARAWRAASSEKGSTKAAPPGYLP
jgi:hypothetical protein